ncbi:MAG: hypothetical protein IAX21_07035 [Candidatus Bathyarchaeota archaeon]|nr:hypothetical protein [Candidatus Bathyarchaeum tardum]WGM89303.1 MAG: hypothetical protein NUK63_10390 [Candidatus Bathyarchaeum tardum]WNZ28416.1 MAG: hypothetical protein IAX21_07035 [Candidatus Bathyarchaeota archaeon]
MKKAFTIPLVCMLLIVTTGFLVSSVHETSSTPTNADCLVGVAFCGNTTQEAKLLIDRVKDYTNLFVLQSGPVSENETATTEICDYAVEAGLDLIVFFGDLDPQVLQIKEEFLEKNVTWRTSWLAKAKEKYGDKILGIYYYDEPGGKWLDFQSWNILIERAFNVTDYHEAIVEATYDEVAEAYIRADEGDRGYHQIRENSLMLFSSDYVLYWFDYLMGYDVMLAQIGWNHTLAQDIALIRGAATMQNKSWGTIITWKYNNPPYLDSAENIYDQMLTSYKTGAEYIVLFNYPTYPETNQFGIMTDNHFETLENFWNNVVTNSEVIHGSEKAEAVLVLPQNYGWGMRSPTDKIWAFLEPIEESDQIWTNLCILLEKYDINLDIIYDDPNYAPEDIYTLIYYWNQRINP